MGCGSSKAQAALLWSLKESVAKLAELEAKVSLTELQGKVELGEKGLAKAVGSEVAGLEAKVTELQGKVKLGEKKLAEAVSRAASQAEVTVKELKEAKKAEDAAANAEREAAARTIARGRSAHTLQRESVYKGWQTEACAHAFEECEALFEDVEDAQKVKCANAMVPVHCAKGLVLVHQGDDSEAHFFVIAFGTFDCHVFTDKRMRHTLWADTEITDETATLVKTYTSGDFFGEIGLMNDLARQASLTCTSSAALVWSLSKTDCARATHEHWSTHVIARQEASSCARSQTSRRPGTMRRTMARTTKTPRRRRLRIPRSPTRCRLEAVYSCSWPPSLRMISA